jgi:hypothetical protein
MQKHYLLLIKTATIAIKIGLVVMIMAQTAILFIQYI